jgi:nicotinamide-nucleotide amidase
MNAAIITIGDEILIGQIVDTNSAWIASQLALAGYNIIEIRSVSDSQNHIHSALKAFEGNTDLVVLTGGLGPTRDDTTRGALASYFGGTLKENPEVLHHIYTLFAARGMKISETNRLQAVVPDSCEILKNRSGTAPGMLFRKSGTIFVSLPGVPYELKDIFTEELIPKLADIFHGPLIVHRTVMTQGIPESYLAAKIQDWELSLPPNVKLAYLPRPGIVRLRLTASGKDRNSLAAELAQLIDKLLKIIPDEVFATEDIGLEARCGQLLLDHHKTVATAESCTGGSISSAITSVPGSSAYYKGSVIAYDNSVKVKELGVTPEMLNNSGAVSREVAEQMANAVRIKMDTDFGVAVTGVAGPGGGSEAKPVGYTWIAVASAKNCTSRNFLFGEHRGRNVEKSVQAALNMLRIKILEY